MSPARPSRVLVCDIEGTLTDKSGRKSSPRLLARLRSLQDGGAILVLASGRGAAYLRRLRREWGLGEGPLVAENGCCVSPGGKVLPAYERTDYERQAIVKRLRAAGVRRLAELDPAKRHAVTLYPRGFQEGRDYSSKDLGRIYRFLRRELRGVRCSIYHTSASGEVLPPGVDKGTGLRFLFEKAALDASGAVFLCDGHNDLPAARYILRSGGRVGAPANAVPALRRMATFVSRRRYYDGALDALDRLTGRS